MSAHPVTVPGDIDIPSFIDQYVLRSPYSTFPVVDRSGRVAGLLTLRRVKHLPRSQWPYTRAIDVACPLDEVPIARPNEPIVSALERMTDTCAEGRELVMDDGRLVGLLSPSDIGRALELAEMIHRP